MASFETVEENEAVALLNETAGYQAVWIGLYQDLNDVNYNEPDGGWKWVSATSECQTTTVEEVTSYAQDDASFAMQPTCDGAIVTNIATPGGVFSFVVLPTDGATIDPDTGTITNAFWGDPYEISYTTNDNCPTSTSIEVFLSGETAKSFFLSKLNTPIPQIKLGESLVGIADFCKDISDGFLKEVRFISEISNLQANIFLSEISSSAIISLSSTSINLI